MNPARLEELFQTLEAIRRHPSTVYELETRLRQPIATLYRDLSVLAALEWVHVNGHRRRSKWGASARVWAITRKGFIILNAWEAVHA